MGQIKVEIYTTSLCPYCEHAKRVLQKKGVDYKEIDVSDDASLRQAMTQRALGRTSVPQIFINDFHVGGADDLDALERAGKLDPLLGL